MYQGRMENVYCSNEEDCHVVFEVDREAEKEDGDFLDCNQIRFENKQKQNHTKGKKKESNIEQ